MVLYRQTLKQHRWSLRWIKTKWLLGGFLIFFFMGSLVGGYYQSTIDKKELDKVKNKNMSLREELGKMTGMSQPSEQKKKGH